MRRALPMLLALAGGCSPPVLPPAAVPPAECCGACAGPLKVNAGFIAADDRWTASPAPVRDEPWDPGPLLVGVGDRLSSMRGEEWVEWAAQAQALGAPVNAHALWITRDWRESWFGPPELRSLREQGIMPVLIFYYFGDDVSQEFVLQQYDAYTDWLHRVLRHLSGSPEALVVLEPEFNNDPPPGEHDVKEWPPFAQLMIQVVAEVREAMPEARVGICPGDYRTYDLWEVLGPVSRYVDFLAFQELWGATRENWLSNEDEDVTEFALLYTAYLRTVLRKPVLLAYLGVSTYPGPDRADWSGIQADILRNLEARIDTFEEMGLFGVLYFELYDDPAHEGYFGPAEKHWGLIDSAGTPKQGFWAFASLAQAIERHNREGVRP